LITTDEGFDIEVIVPGSALIWTTPVIGCEFGAGTEEGDRTVEAAAAATEAEGERMPPEFDMGVGD